MNILLIDSKISNYELFNSSVNANTTSLVYSAATSSQSDILLAIRALNVPTIARIGLVFEINGPRPTLCLEKAPFFQPTDTVEPFSTNVAFLIALINEFQVANIDFLACNSLNMPAWVNYYALLAKETGVIVGASNNDTGNIQYGGDWLMESTSQDIELIYFTASIENYASLLTGGAAGDNYSVVLKSDGTVYGTGYNSGGQLGLGNYDISYNTLQQMLPVAGKTPKYISCAGLTTIVLMTDGTVYGTGVNSNGQLGLGNYTLKYNTLQPMDMSGNIAKYISCAGLTTIVLMTDNTVWGTGRNSNGQLGLGNYTTKYNTLQQMLMPAGEVKYISSGGYTNAGFTIVLMTDGTVYSTGDNSLGQLGDGTDGNSYNTLQQMLPVAGKTPKYISSGIYYTLVLMTDGTVYGTGDNYYGQLGDGTDGNGYNTLQQMLPVVGKTPANISCGDWEQYANGAYSIVLMTDGTVYGTGDNAAGQLGNGTDDNQYNTLQQMDMTNVGGRLAKSISTAGRHTLVLMTDKTVYGTGYNVYGELGLGDNIDYNTLQPMLNGDNVVGPFSLLDIIDTPVPCFKADTKILTQEGYKPIQELRKGDLIKTLRDGYKPIVLIGKRDIYHYQYNNATIDVAENENSLYRCSLQNYPELFEELIITGTHSILVDDLTALQREKTIKVLSKIYVTDDKYRLPACVDERATIYEKSGTYTIYHLALEHENYYMNYGIYANGLIVETCSKRYLKEYSGMMLL